MRSAGKRITAVLAALAIAAALGSCSRSSSTDVHAGHAGVNSTPDAQSAIHNADDVAFARNMIPHHQQAVDMSAMVPTNTHNRDVIVLAKHISLDQQAEIDTMQGLLAQWGEPAAAEHGGHAGHGGMPMEGMVDDATIDQLRSLTGADFDRLWLRSMISHHQGAVTMAQIEIARGLNPDALKLARIIVDAQQWEIATHESSPGCPRVTVVACRFHRWSIVKTVRWCAHERDKDAGNRAGTGGVAALAR